MGATNPNAGGAPGGGGKGGMGMNRGPGGNAQNNPGGPQANFGMDQMTWGGRPAPYNGPLNPFSNVSQMPSFQFNRPEMQSGNLTPINQAIPTPQPHQPVQPQFNSAGLPAGGLLAKLYGG